MKTALLFIVACLIALGANAQTPAGSIQWSQRNSAVTGASVTATGGDTHTLADWFKGLTNSGTILTGNEADFTHIFAGRSGGIAHVTSEGFGPETMAISSYVSQSGATNTSPFPHYLVVTSDTMDSTGVPNGIGGDLAIVHNFGGAGAKGVRYAFSSALTQTAQTGNTTDLYRQYAGAFFGFFGNATEGGTAPTPGNSAGFGFGFNGSVGLGAAATNWGAIFGGEIDLEADSGASYQYLSGLLITLKGLHAAHGNNGVDSALWINAPTSTTWFDYGILLGTAGLHMPLMTTGTILGALGNSAVAFGVDLSNITIGTAAFKSNGFLVSGSGALTAASYKAGAAAGVSCPANTVVLATEVVTNGIITHC